MGGALQGRRRDVAGRDQGDGAAAAGDAVVGGRHSGRGGWNGWKAGEPSKPAVTSPPADAPGTSTRGQGFTVMSAWGARSRPWVAWASFTAVCDEEDEADALRAAAVERPTGTACELASRCGRGVRLSLEAAAAATTAAEPAWAMPSGITRSGAGTEPVGATAMGAIRAGAAATEGGGTSSEDNSAREPISAASATDAASAAPPPQRNSGRRAPGAAATAKVCSSTTSSTTGPAAIARPTRREKSAGSARPA